MKLKKQENVEIRYLHDCILIQKKILVIGDIHIGYDEHFDGKAIFPGMQLDEIREKLDAIFNYLKLEGIIIKKTILLGDVKHDFGSISDLEWRETLTFLDYLQEKSQEIIIIKGNHDTILDPIVKKRNIQLRNYYRVNICGNALGFFHGDKMFKQCLDKQTTHIFFGHLHPAIILEDRYKSEKYKCFLQGKWKGKQVFILPSFSSWSYGFDVSQRSDKKFFVIDQKDLMNFEAVIYDFREHASYNFGKVKNYA